MKKIYAILAAAAALAAASSCNKAETVEPEVEPGKVTVNITVASLAPETKAVKTGWSSGDIINVYLDDKTSNITPDFSLTYDGSNWVSSTISPEVEARLKATGGTLKGFWEGSNSCFESGSEWTKNGQHVFNPNRTNYATTGITGYLVAYFNDISYTYSSGKLTAAISSWTLEPNFQFVISGISYSAGRYTLYSDYGQMYNARRVSISSGKKMEVGYYGSDSSMGRIAGIPNDDGVAFVGKVVLSRVTLYLLDNTTGKTYSFSKSGITKDDFNAVKIPFSKFTEE